MFRMKSAVYFDRTFLQQILLVEFVIFITFFMFFNCILFYVGV